MQFYRAGVPFFLINNEHKTLTKANTPVDALPLIYQRLYEPGKPKANLIP